MPIAPPTMLLEPRTRGRRPAPLASLFEPPRWAYGGLQHTCGCSLGLPLCWDLRGLNPRSADGASAAMPKVQLRVHTSRCGGVAALAMGRDGGIGLNQS